jgi:hypothetical protein
MSGHEVTLLPSGEVQETWHGTSGVGYQVF